jgi:hypothetical protein
MVPPARRNPQEERRARWSAIEEVIEDAATQIGMGSDECHF